MLRVEHPEVLAYEWIPPTLVGRAPDLERLRRLLGDPLPERAPPWIAGVAGPPGSGTSAVARLAARRLVEAYRRERPGATAPLLVAVRVRWCAGTHGVATALLQSLDDGFSGQGFPVVEIVAGFLRRLGRLGRPAVVVLDDLGPDTPDLGPILRGLRAPLRFLPEGVDAAPPIWTIVAGQIERPGTLPSRRAYLPDATETVALTALDAAATRAIVRDRAERALARPVPEEWLDRVLGAPGDRPLPAARALDRLRRELLGPTAGRFPVPPGPRGVPRPLYIEPHVVEALGQAGDGRLVPLHELREEEARIARAKGVRPLPATTFWRRLVQLEAVGLVRREVRPGGSGGTRSRVQVLRPVSEWPVPRPEPRSHPGAASFEAARASGAGPAREGRPDPVSGGAGERSLPRAPSS